MSRRTMLVLAAGAIVSGCSRDGPIVAPQMETEEAVVALPPVAAALAGDPTADAVDDALDDAIGRLLPALGEHGTSLRSRLQVLKTNRGNKAARDDLRRVLELLASTIPESYRGDLDALRLELGAVIDDINDPRRGL